MRFFSLVLAVALVAAGARADTVVDEFSDGAIALTLNDVGQVSQAASGANIIGGARSVNIELIAVEIGGAGASFAASVNPALVNSGNTGALIVR
jgi:hypothetical protein